MAVESKPGPVTAKPLSIFKVGIVGGGAMGGGIAQVVSAAGLPVVIKDVSQEFVDKGLNAAFDVYDRRVKKGKMTASEAEQKKALITGSLSYEDFADCDLVIEAVTEKMAIKKIVFAELDKVLPAHAIVASNTSALSITELGRSTGRQAKVAGLHFFNPAPVMQLVEVIRGEDSSDETIATLLAFSKDLRKNPVSVNRDSAGFLVNRLLLAFFNEATLALEENGAGSLEKIDQAIAMRDFPMGPFTLADMVGVDVITHVMHTLHEAFGERYPIAHLLDSLVAAGRIGQKGGAGFYGGEEGWLDQAIKALPADLKLEPTPISYERFIAVMINEGARMVEEGTVALDDVDWAMQQGTGMAQGPFHIADEMGIDAVLKVLEEHRKLGTRFEPVELLRKMVSDGKLGKATGEGFFKHEAGAATKRQFVTYDLEEGAAVLTINNPPMNVLGSTVLAELSDCIDELAESNACKAIVLTGAGDLFVAGADIKEIAGISTAAQAQELVMKGHAIFNKIENLDKPVIVAINGFCLGGGQEMVMACHIRLMADTAKIGQPEIKLGIIPGFGGSQRLPRIVGYARATEWLLTGDLYTAQQAYEIGLINKVVPRAEILNEAKALAKKIAAKGMVAISATMRALREGREVPLMRALEIEAREFGRTCETEDKAIGVAAFLKKDQNPKFVDR